jgi:hypothetical protein
MAFLTFFCFPMGHSVVNPLKLLYNFWGDAERGEGKEEHLTSGVKWAALNEWKQKNVMVQYFLLCKMEREDIFMNQGIWCLGDIVNFKFD